MKLTFEQIEKITTGTARIIKGENGVEFYRFTEEQEHFEKVRVDDLYQRSLTSSGVSMYFKTDSETLTLDVNTSCVKCRQYFSFDVFVNGEYYDCLKNFEKPENEFVCSDYSGEYPLGDFRKTFSFGKGEKKITILFPFAPKVVLHSLELDDGASVIPDKPEKILLCYGDSITQGYDTLHPKNKYTAILARHLGAAEYNKGIGGDICVGEFPIYKDNIKPDYITVAYGTNDWCCCPVNIFIRHTKMFYEKLVEAYPDSRIFAISPIWRKNWAEDARLGKFFDVEKNIKELTKDYENVTVIEGFDLIPHEDKYFSDAEVLHPNDEGFKLYGENLALKIKEKLI